ncbi:palld [Pungitius sinensis]
MQDGRNQPLPISRLPKDPAGGGALDGDGGVSSDGELCLDSATELDSGDGDFADLTAFLSAEEIHRSLDLALEAFGAALGSEDPGPASNPTCQERVPQPVRSPPPKNLHTRPSVQHQTKAPTPAPPEVPPNRRPHATTEAAASVGKAARPKPKEPVYKQDKPRLVHEGLELNDRAASATEFCSRAATFIEELSSIFKGPARSEQQQAEEEEEDSSSPDSGYLTPRGQRPAPQGSASSPAPRAPREPAGTPAGPEPPQHPGAPAPLGPLSPPCFLHKLKSQEVAEGSAVRLECRVTGNPPPLVR